MCTIDSQIFKLIHDFLTNGNKVRLNVYIFLAVSGRGVSSWPNG